MLMPRYLSICADALKGVIDLIAVAGDVVDFLSELVELRANDLDVASHVSSRNDAPHVILGEHLILDEIDGLENVLGVLIHRSLAYHTSDG
jgi:hypothetical protein